MAREGIVLGHLVSERGIEIDKAKIEVTEQLPPPMNVKGIHSFLGHVGFYRRFIKVFSQIARPLMNLLAKDAPLERGGCITQPKRHSSICICSIWACKSSLVLIIGVDRNLVIPRIPIKKTKERELHQPL